MSNGKGDKRRKPSITYKEWCDNYESIFRKEEDKKPKKEKKK